MIDIKTLRIGCHVLYNGERREVGGILGSLVGLIIKESEEKDKRVNLIEVSDELLDPIPITEELLKELGFEYTSGKRAKCFNIIDNFEKSIGGLNRIKLETGDIDDMEDGFDLRITTTERDLYVEGIRYLHELENFVYLTTKKELI